MINRVFIFELIIPASLMLGFFWIVISKNAQSILNKKYTVLFLKHKFRKIHKVFKITNITCKNQNGDDVL